jgi:hypothetical protein
MEGDRLSPFPGFPDESTLTRLVCQARASPAVFRRTASRIISNAPIYPKGLNVVRSAKMRLMTNPPFPEDVNKRENYDYVSHTIDEKK